MKRTFYLAALISISIVFLPISHLRTKPAKEKILPAAATSLRVSYDKDEVYFKLYRNAGKKTEKISAKDYILGVVASEMPLTFEKEALKAQAVAAYSFALYKKERAAEKYDLTDSFQTDQAYTPIEELCEKWGENADKNLELLNDIYSSIEGKRLTYKGDTALCVYHAISNGKTNSASDVWGSDIPYLKSVDSSFDKTAQGYKSVFSLKSEELAEKLSSLNAVSGEPSNYLNDIKKNGGGYVLSLNFCGKTLSGSEIAKALSLRSASFDIGFSDNTFTFTVYGYGHGVGLSQTGANLMAKQGSSYKEILYHYYPDCKISK